MSIAGYLFFMLFAIAQVAMYLTLRRGLAAPTTIAAIGLPSSVVLAALMAAFNGNGLGQVMFVGLLMGGLVGGVTLAIAYFFHTTTSR